MILIAVASLASLVALPAASPAKPVKKYKTTVKIEGTVFVPEAPARAQRRADTGYWMLYGRVTSPKSKCSKSRKVKFTYRDGGIKKLGYDTTDSEGSFALRIHITEFPNSADEFIAKAGKRKLSKRALCKVGRGTLVDT